VRITHDGESDTMINTVLVAIRDEDLANAIAKLLHQAGHAPIVVVDVGTAVRALASCEVGLVICEPATRDRSAIHLRNVLRAAWPHVPVLVLLDTGAPASPAMSAGDALGLVISSPIDASLLLAAVSRALASSVPADIECR